MQPALQAGGGEDAGADFLDGQLGGVQVGNIELVVERLQGRLLEAVGEGEGEVEQVLVSLQAEEERDAESVRQTEVGDNQAGVFGQH